MLIPLRPVWWQSLRVAVRQNGVPVPGRSLRIAPTRDTKNGAFLQHLVDAGLLKVVKKNSDPFEATYTLTAAGERAAEYGVYEVEVRLKWE